MIEPFRSILWTLGTMIILMSAIIIVVFMAWIIKIEFLWFFETDLLKWLRKSARDFKVKFVKFFIKVRRLIDKSNNKDS